MDKEFIEFLKEAQNKLNSKHEFHHAYLLPERVSLSNLTSLIEFLNTRELFII